MWPFNYLLHRLFLLGIPRRKGSRDKRKTINNIKKHAVGKCTARCLLNWNLLSAHCNCCLLLLQLLLVVVVQLPMCWATSGANGSLCARWECYDYRILPLDFIISDLPMRPTLSVLFAPFSSSYTYIFASGWPFGILDIHRSSLHSILANHKYHFTMNSTMNFAMNFKQLWWPENINVSQSINTYWLRSLCIGSFDYNY